MRYYKISFVDPITQGNLRGTSVDFPSVFTSMNADGTFNPGALEVEFEIANGWGHNLLAQTHLRIHNPTLSMVQNSNRYNGALCVIEGGFMTGLPLANPALAGILGTGIVYNSYANWLGTDLVLDFLLYPNENFGDVNLYLSSDTGAGSPGSFHFKWNSGSLLDAITATFSSYGIKVTGTVRDALSSPPAGGIDTWFSNFQSYAEFVKNLTVSIINPAAYSSNGTTSTTGRGQWQTYYGVMMDWIPNLKEIQVYDGTTSTGAIQLNYDEFIGQPTWLNNSGMLQSVHPMRSDISMGFSIKYPASIPSQANPFNIAIRDQLVSPSSGPLFVMGVRHMGRFRDTSPTGWVTFVDAARSYRVDPYQASVPEGEVTVEPLIPVA